LSDITDPTPACDDVYPDAAGKPTGTGEALPVSLHYPPNGAPVNGQTCGNSSAENAPETADRAAGPDAAGPHVNDSSAAADAAALEALASEIEANLRPLYSASPPDAQVELRAIGPFTDIISSPASRLGRLARSAAFFSQGETSGVYVTLNPLRPGYRAGRPERNPAARDGDVLKRCLLLVDCDPVKAAGPKANSTDEEKAKAKAVALAIRDYLQGLGWPDGLLLDSGNGYHLLYLIDLPNDCEFRWNTGDPELDGTVKVEGASRKLVRRVLLALARRFDSGDVKIDTKVFNASRITKCYGTTARKGKNTPERPWRKSSVVVAPEVFLPVPRELLEKVAAEAPPDESGGLGGGDDGGGSASSSVSSGGNAQAGTAAADRPLVWSGPELERVLGYARKYVAKMPPSIEGQDGSTSLFKAAQALVRGMLLTPEQALPLLREFNATPGKCVPKWTDLDINRKLAQAELVSRLPWGYLVRKSRRLAPWLFGGGGPPGPQTALRDSKAPRPAAPLIRFAELQSRAKAAPPEYVIDGLLRFGEVNLTAAPEWAGKSALLNYALGCVAQGLPFLGRNTVRAPVVLVNADQKDAEYVHTQVVASLLEEGAKVAELTDYLFCPDFDLLEYPVTAAHVEEWIDGVEAALNGGRPMRGVLSLDTFRNSLLAGAPSGTEFDPKVSDYLRPITTLARRRGWAVILPHHTKKTDREEYSGNPAIKALVNSFWKYVRAEGSDYGLLTVTERRTGGKATNLYVRQEAGGGFLLHEPPTVAEAVRMTDHLTAFVRLWPARGEGEARTLKGVFDGHRAAFAAWGLSELKSAKKWVTRAKDQGRLVVHPDDEGKPGTAPRYYRSQEGVTA
jgi:hypothetical protein